MVPTDILCQEIAEMKTELGLLEVDDLAAMALGAAVLAY